MRTIFTCLGRCQDREHRTTVSTACLARAGATTGLSLILYDCTTLYFEAERQDGLRTVGMGKERRLDPQILLGLWVDAAGLALAVHCLEGNTAETRTLIPVVPRAHRRLRCQGPGRGRRRRDAVRGEPGRPGRRRTAVRRRVADLQVAYDLADHVERHGNYVTDGQVLESGRERRVVYQYLFKRDQRDQQATNAQVARAEKVPDRTRPVKKDRSVRFDGTHNGVKADLVQRARDLAALRGYVTSIDVYHDLYQVERSFRMARTDLAAGPMFHHQRAAIEAHLTVVFPALAVARHLQALTGVWIRKPVQTLSRSSVARVDVEPLEAPHGAFSRSDGPRRCDVRSAAAEGPVWSGTPADRSSRR